jgi:superfamily I DNA and RNA helicase
VDATIQSGQVHKQGLWSYWAEITYTYFVGEYRTGKHVHRFRNEEAADEFVRQIKDKHVLVHYDSNKPDTSVILDRDLEMIALLTPQYR